MKSSNIIFNDPLYGFVSIPRGIIFEIINHRYFQRLRRIKQLGLTTLVYPSANHTRFQHTLGAVHLMCKSLDVLRSKGVEISDEEYEASCLAILLHDIGHGPFSHALEYNIVENVHHEEISLHVMDYFNQEFEGKLDLCIEIFTDNYKRKFFHQMISSQLDLDRLDYLNRDSFFTGVAEGVVGVDRIINILNVKDDQLAIEQKGIYSIENFLLARRLMYWQVYLHKNVIICENTLLKIVQRAKELVRNGKELFMTSSLRFFFEKPVDLTKFTSDPNALEAFMRLDDEDLTTCIKEWCEHSDPVLSYLCRTIIHRRLLTIDMEDRPFSEQLIDAKKEDAREILEINDDALNYLVFTGISANRVYNLSEANINILTPSGEILDVLDASDQFNTSILSRPVKKYYICYPK